MNIFKKKILAASLVLLFGLVVAVPAMAQLNTWGDQYAEQEDIGFRAFWDIGMGTNDPRVVAAQVVQVLLGFLGVLAILYLMYGGFIWMTASGDAEKVDKAKTILQQAVIGLLIILSSFLLALFILRALAGATGAEGAAGTGCDPADSPKDCYCGGKQFCIDGKWTACLGDDCSDDEDGSGYCGEALLQDDQGQCIPDDELCLEDEYCNVEDGCRCRPAKGYGQSCDADEAQDGCQAEEDCASYLSCDIDAGCVCLGEPVIKNISPGDGAPGTLITIHGSYFQEYDPDTSRVFFWSSEEDDFTIEAELASQVNPLCPGSWTDNQIIVVVPEDAESGPIRVVAENGDDDTNDDRGPEIDDFEVNDQVRPGLCGIDPEAAVYSSNIDFFGLNLQGAIAFFGNAANNIKSPASSFSIQTQGSATVPNLRPGSTTTFVTKADIQSNYLYFETLSDKAAEPFIVGFEPASGPAGEYITIKGGNFGREQGSVFFGEEMGDFNFPRVCSQSVWRDNEIIVKVPQTLGDDNLDLPLIVKPKQAKSVTADNQFQYVADAPLNPGVCRMDPLFGQAGDEIMFWGEYFGKYNEESRVRFSRNQVRSNNRICYGGSLDGDYCEIDQQCPGGQCSEEISFWGVGDDDFSDGADKATTRIHFDAITGPVYIENGERVSNPVNLTLGECQSDKQCGGTNVCCGQGTPKEGRCEESMDKCFGDSATSVYEWEFNTGFDNNCPDNKPFLCQDGSCCSTACVLDNNEGMTVCLDNASCAGYNADLCLDTIFCPNSPGNCSLNPEVVVTAGSCNCALRGCPECVYDTDLNRCILPPEDNTCSLPEPVLDVNGNYIDKYCATFEGESRWHIRTGQTCPDGFTKAPDDNSLCIDLDSQCDLCPDDLKCIDDDGQGICSVNLPICPNNFECTADEVCTRDSGLCECCCDKEDNNADGTNPACCAPLTCDYQCGASAFSETDKWGYCSGCADVGTTQAEHDAACICEGTTGKYCDTSDPEMPTGICRDCASISDPEECSAHLYCCVDYQNGNACRGVTETRYEEDGLAYCGYYDCYDDCESPGKEKAYGTQDECYEECELNCDVSDEPGCQAGGCPENYTCNDDCICEEEGRGPGEPCESEEGLCTLNCLFPYGCISEFGQTGADVPAADTCRCCCDPDNTSENPDDPDYDLCNDLSPELGCEADRGDCTGVERGLCCGCSSDEQCGNVKQVGCGNDTCCHPRPQVEEEYPANGATDTCRNTLIEAKFNNKMNLDSFLGNVILIGDYGSRRCPENTVILADAVLEGALDQDPSFWQQALSLVVNEARAQASSNFCGIPLNVRGYNFTEKYDERSAAVASPKIALDSDTRYYVVLRGNRDNKAEAILSAEDVVIQGMNVSDRDDFNTIIYPNAHIWAFDTGTEICQVEQVQINPSSYLFQSPGQQYDSFMAYALSGSGQKIASIPGLYAWTWNWWSDDVEVAEVEQNQTNSEMALVTAGSDNDKQTDVWAEVNIVEDVINDPSSVGRRIANSSLVTLFFCENPWPAVLDPAAWPFRWEDRNSNCSVCFDPASRRDYPCNGDNSTCYDNHFQVYYCRDKDSKGSADDLPALAEDPPIRARYEYKKGNVFVEVLKDFYFFWQPRPEAPNGLTIENTGSQTGGEVRLSWSASADKYKIYFGDKSGDYDYVIVSEETELVIDALRNETVYYFAVTALTEKNIESRYSDEVSIMVTDEAGPAMPENLSGEVDISDDANNQIILSWQPTNVDTSAYTVEYGPSENPATSLNVGYTSNYTIEGVNNIETQSYNVWLYAVDSWGNRSQPAELDCSCSGDECFCE